VAEETKMVPAQQAGERGLTMRQEFGVNQTQTQAELAVAAVAAREEAMVKAEYVMAERHPRVWLDVRGEMLSHCKRPRFADVSRYAKPVGKKKVNGEWVEEVARGFTARFAETLAQEMGNVKPFSHVTYEDELVRVVRFGVTDLQKNLPRSREVTFAKAVEKRGKKDRQTGNWSPPEGRELVNVNPRLNSYGDPVWLVKATDDEMRNKVNSEESKTQRDFILRLCPRDILEECEDVIARTLSNEDRTDPTAALKRILDRFRELSGITPGDLEQYMGKACAKFGPADLQELRELGAAIRDGVTTFDEAMKAKYTTKDPETGAEVVGSAKEAAEVAEKKIAELQAEAKPAVPVQPQGPAPSAPPVEQKPAPPEVLKPAVAIPVYESWEAFDAAGSLVLPRIVVAGAEFVWSEESGNYQAAPKPEPPAEQTRRRPQFGRPVK
jgi:hypothetical protein